MISSASRFRSTFLERILSGNRIYGLRDCGAWQHEVGLVQLRYQDWQLDLESQVFFEFDWRTRKFEEIKFMDSVSSPLGSLSFSYRISAQAPGRLPLPARDYGIRVGDFNDLVANLVTEVPLTKMERMGCTGFLSSGRRYKSSGWTVSSSIAGGWSVERSGRLLCWLLRLRLLL